jgi:hypothetical protein
MRPVVFVKYYDKVSTILAADQMSEALRARGIESRSIHVEELAGVSDSTLIFIKTSKLPHLWRARRRRNILILDIHDTLVFKRRIKNRRLFHGLIFRNGRQRRDFSPRGGPRGPPATTIYLHWDPRFGPNEVGAAGFKVGYLGDRRSLSLWGELPGVPCYGFDEVFEAARGLNCHLSVRTTPREMRYKPGIKVVTAAACDAVLVTTRDASAVELLGPEYPYYTEPDRDSVLRAIEHARETFNTPLWHSALDTMRGIKLAHTIEAETDEYLAYLRRFD